MKAAPATPPCRSKPADPLVSVVIACRNESRWITAAVRSALDQTWRQLEVIVVDDGSSDDTAARVAALDDPRLTLLRTPPTGACAARNLGLQHARGDLLQMLDGDDLLDPWKIERQVGRWRRDGDDGVCFGPYVRFGPYPNVHEAVARPNWCDLDGHDWLVSNWLHGGMMPPHSWLTPMWIARAAGPWDETLLQNQDGDYFSRVLLAAPGGVRYCPDTWSYYRAGDAATAISLRSDHGARASTLRATEAIAARLLARNDSPRTRRACANALEEQMFRNWTLHPDLAERARREVSRLQGSDGRMPYRGRRFRLVAGLIGWRAACRLQGRLGLDVPARPR